MKKQLFLASIFCLLAAVSCESGRHMQKTTHVQNEKTQEEQVMSEKDRTLTQKIRQSLLDDPALSPEAKNIKILTVNQVVTLRGDLKNEAEKNELTKKVRAFSEVKSVDNQIKILSANP